MAPLSEAKRRANNKYNLAHMATLGCKVKKEQATAFKDYASERGKTANTMLRDYVLDCIGDDAIQQKERDKQTGEA